MKRSVKRFVCDTAHSREPRATCKLRQRGRAAQPAAHTGSASGSAHSTAGGTSGATGREAAQRRTTPREQRTPKGSAHRNAHRTADHSRPTPRSSDHATRRPRRGAGSSTQGRAQLQIHRRIVRKLEAWKPHNLGEGDTVGDSGPWIHNFSSRSAPHATATDVVPACQGRHWVPELG